jgi:hypothetical protein
MPGEIFSMRLAALWQFVLVGRVIGRPEQLLGFWELSALRVGADTP